MKNRLTVTNYTTLLLHFGFEVFLKWPTGKIWSLAHGTTEGGGRIFRMGRSAWVSGGITILESDRGSTRSLLLSFFASLPIQGKHLPSDMLPLDVLPCHRSKSSRLTGLGTSETLNQNKRFFLLGWFLWGVCTGSRKLMNTVCVCMWQFKAVKRFLGP